MDKYWMHRGRERVSEGLCISEYEGFDVGS